MYFSLSSFAICWFAVPQLYVRIQTKFHTQTHVSKLVPSNRNSECRNVDQTLAFRALRREGGLTSYPRSVNPEAALLVMNVIS